MIYALFRTVFRIATHVFFRRIDVEHGDRVPSAGPMLLVPNHTNAFVDPIVLLLQLGRPVTLTAKSTLARNPLLAWAMRVFDVIAFQRREDREGEADPERNAGALTECRRRLKDGAAVCIFPEGVSHSDPKMRRFKTGAARVALEYLDRDGNHGRLRIVPVGLHYEKKDRFRSSVSIGFGEPMDVAEWRRAHPGAGARELTATIEASVRELTLNFEQRAESDLFRWAADLVATGGRQPLPLGQDEGPRLSEHVRVVRRLQDGYRQLRQFHAEELEALGRRIAAYRLTLKRLGIAPHEVYLPMHWSRAVFFVLREMELLLVGLPLALWGVLNHLVPFGLVHGIARGMSADEDHFASNAVFLSVVLFPLCYALQIGAAWLTLPTVGALVYTVALPYTGAYAIMYRDRAGGTWQRTRTFVRFVLHRDLQEHLVEEGRAIILEVERLNKARSEHGNTVRR